MGLIDRILRVIRANLNSLVGQAEDPEKILEQAVEDMQQDLIQLRQAVAQAIATQKRTERQASQAQSTAMSGTTALNWHCLKGMKTWRGKP
jgi:phage shock protein A